MRRLTGRRLIPRRYWGAVEVPDGQDEVVIDGDCPPSPVATDGDGAEAACPPVLPAPRHVRGEPRQAEPGEARRQHARHLASLYAFGGGIVGAAPIPSPDMPLLISIESRLVADIARMYDPGSARSAVARAAPLLGLGGYLLRGLARRGYRHLPMLGWLINGMVAYAGVRLAGEAAMRWCEARQQVYDYYD